MNQDIKVSIIAPVYNIEKYLPVFLDCMVRQTLQEIEVIMVNDCSPDGCGQIIRSYCEKDKRILMVNNENNMGQALSRNEGLKVARGEYILFLDPDDIVCDDAVEIMYASAVENNADVTVAYGGFFLPGDKALTVQYYMGKDRALLNTSSVYCKEQRPDLLFKLTTNSGCGKLFRREMMVSNNIEFTHYKYSDDMPLAFKCMIGANKVSYVLKEIYYYRQNRAGNVTTSNAKAKTVIVDVLRDILSFLKKSDSYELLIGYFWEFAIPKMYTCLDNTDEIIYENVKKEILEFFEEEELLYGSMSEFNQILIEKIGGEHRIEPFTKVLMTYRCEKNCNPVITRFWDKRNKLTDYVYDGTKLSLAQVIVIFWYELRKAFFNKMHIIKI